MTVSALIEILGDCDPDAEVLLGIQPGYPFEHSVAGVAVRKDADRDDEDVPEEGRKPDTGNSWTNNGRPNDVIICEGGQLRYASKALWDAARCG